MKKRQSQTKQTLRPKLRYNCSCWIQEEHRQPIFGVALNNAFGPRSDDPSNAVPQLCATAGANKCVEVPSPQINVLFCQFWSLQELLHKILYVSICLCVDHAFTRCGSMIFDFILPLSQIIYLPMLSRWVIEIANGVH